MSDTSLRWRDRASNLRHTAEGETDPIQEAKLLDLAAQWEALAAQADEAEGNQRKMLKPLASVEKKDTPRAPKHKLSE